MTDPYYEFEVAGSCGILRVRLTRSEFEELRRSNPTKYGRLFAADLDAYRMRCEVEGRPVEGPAQFPAGDEPVRGGVGD